MAVLKPVKAKQIRAELAKELNFIKNIFSIVSLPTKGDTDDNQDYLIPSKTTNKPEENKQSQRARSITELEERLQKLKSQSNFNLKKKLEKKSLSSKLNKKIKKRERLNKNKVIVKEPKQKMIKNEDVKTENVNIAKPVFNHDGKLVFSKFDFANMGKKEKTKSAKDPKKILENLKQQEQMFQELEEKEESGKVKEIKEKVAWKNVLQKAEGQKVKDDPTLLKKSIKKMEQMKKHSKKQWETRIQGVQQKKEERQQKRKENISKKKKEKKSKIVKAAVKRGRVVI